MARQLPGILLLVALVTSTGACNLLSDSTSPSGTTTTETFSGAVVTGGSSVFEFTEAAAGTVAVTLTALGTAGPVGLGLGTPTGTSGCTLATSSATTTAGTTAQISVTENPGAYCVEIYDVGDITTPTTFSITVAHS